MKFNRINVVGSSGSSKSTLGRAIADKIDAPYVEIDEINWKPNWTEATDSELFGDLQRALSGEKWVLDGNYSRTESVKWARVEQIVWLDLPYWLVLYQVFTRTIRPSVIRETLWAGNRESLFKAFFSRDSILLWCMTNLARIRRQYEADLNNLDLSHIKITRLRSREEVGTFLDNLSPQENSIG